MALWEFKNNRYRLTSEGAQSLGGRPGSFLSESRILEIRDALIGSHKDDVALWAQQLANGDLSMRRWTTNMQGMIKNSHIQEYVLGRGGRGNMTQSDWGRLGHDIRDQYAYLRGFAEDIIAGRYEGKSADTIMAQLTGRGGLYTESSSASFELGFLAGKGLDPSMLSQVPGDGKTQCMTNCKCHLVIREMDTEFHVDWRLSDAEHCEDCVRLSNEWTPLIIPK